MQKYFSLELILPQKPSDICNCDIKSFEQLDMNIKSFEQLGMNISP